MLARNTKNCPAPATLYSQAFHSRLCSLFLIKNDPHVKVVQNLEQTVSLTKALQFVFTDCIVLSIADKVKIKNTTLKVQRKPTQPNQNIGLEKNYNCLF